jgi:hypothetical protein
MNTDMLIDLATQFLKTPKGSKLLGDKINILEITTQISSLSKKYNINLEELTSASAKEKVSANKNSNKVDKTLTAKERIQQKKDVISDEGKASISRVKDQILALKAKLRSEIPALETYTITGRIFDKQTGDVLSGAKVQLGVNPDIDAKVDNPLNSNTDLISSKPNLNFKDAIFIPVPNNESKTDKQGNFSIEVKIPVIPKNQKTPLRLGLLYTKSGYLPGSSPIINGDQTVKTALSASSLLNIDKSAEYIATEFNNKIDEAQALVANLALTPFQLLLSSVKKNINGIVDVVKTKLIPLCIGLLISFGISKLSEVNRKTCPTQAELDDIIRRRNRIVRQLNQIYLTIIKNTALAFAFKTLATALKGIRLSLDAIPAPQAGGTPPMKDFGGFIYALPYSFTASLQKLDDLLESLEDQNSGMSKAQLAALVFLIAATTTILLLLKGIDKMTQECAEEGGVTDIELTAINQELLDLGEEQAEDGNPLIGNVNGFIFSVETDNSNPVGTLKRRFAVAKDSRGITLLKGEPSFSSADQILIDELVFYIQQNDLKAN